MNRIEQARAALALVECSPEVRAALEAILALSEDAHGKATRAEAAAEKINDNVHMWVESVETQLDGLRRDLWT